MRELQMISFMKNLAILGGLLVVLGLGARPFSRDRRLARERGSSATGAGAADAAQ